MNRRLPLLIAVFMAGVGLIFGRTLTTHAANMMTCHATHDDGTTVFSSNNMIAVRQAVNAATADDTIKIAGQCVGVAPHPAQRLVVNKDLTLEGGYTNGDWSVPSPETKETILDANQEGRVLAVNGATVKLKNLHITGGQANFGGGIIVSNGVLLVETTHIFDNQATAGDGGGIYAEDSRVVIYSYSILDNNQASGNGGGLYHNITGNVDGDFTITVNHSEIKNNSAAVGGGGVFAQEPETTTRGLGFTSGIFATSAVWNNNQTQGNGGALYFNNHAATAGRGLGFGGGVFGQNNRWENNSAQGDGGALYIESDPTAARGFGGASGWLSFGAVWEGNSAQNGGAAHVTGVEWITITNSAFLTNSATVDGGGVYVDDNANLIVADGSQFVGNMAGSDGGGIIGTRFARAVWDIYLGAIDFSGNQSGSSGGGLLLENPTSGTFENTAFNGNGSQDDGGGGAIKHTTKRPVRAANAIPYQFTNLMFTNNQANNGGGLAFINSADNVSITVAGLSVTNNSAIQHGGGLFVNADNDAQMAWLLSAAQGRTVPIYEGYANRAGQNGGFMYSAVDGDATSDWLMTSAGNRQQLPTWGAIDISRNNAVNGGGLYAEQSENGRQLFAFNSVLLEGNSAENGAAIFNEGSTVDLDYSIVASNTMTNSGAIVNAGGTMSVTQSVIKQNTASVDAGGFLNVAGTLTIERSLVQGNVAKFDGGGLANRSSDTIGGVAVDGAATANVFGSTFFQNDADSGAAFHNHRPLPIRRNAAVGGSTVLLVNSTLAENAAVNDGGAIWNNSNDGTARVEIVQSTLALNEATNGGGVFNEQSGAGSAEIYLANSINDNTMGDDCTNRAGAFTSNNHNADSDGSCSAAIRDDFAIDRTTESIPQFSLPQNHALSVLPPQRESSVTGVGEVAVCQGALVGGVDQLGNYRLTSMCDLGAVDTSGTSVPTAVALQSADSHTAPTRLLMATLIIILVGITTAMWRKA